MSSNPEQDLSWNKSCISGYKKDLTHVIALRITTSAGEWQKGANQLFEWTYLLKWVALKRDIIAIAVMLQLLAEAIYWTNSKSSSSSSKV